MRYVFILISLYLTACANFSLRYTPEELAERNKSETQKYIDTVNKNMFMIDMRETGGVLRLYVYDEYLAAQRIRKFCNEQKFDNFKLIRSQMGQEYKGNSGGGYTNCTQFGCFTNANYGANYAYYRDLSFECKNENKPQM